MYLLLVEIQLMVNIMLVSRAQQWCDICIPNEMITTIILVTICPYTKLL